MPVTFEGGITADTLELEYEYGKAKQKPRNNSTLAQIAYEMGKGYGGGTGAEGAGDGFTKGSKIPEEVLKAKPKYSPVADKWLENGGKITIENGTWKYTNSQGTSVTYKNGYPDFKRAGHVIQEVNIGGFNNRAADFRKANQLAPKSKSPDSTWHHHEDGKTLQEVNKVIHEQFRHEGGIAGMKKNK